MIHAINSPIGVILGSSQFALEGIDNKRLADLNDADLRDTVESLRVVERQAKRCAQLVKDMRDIILTQQIELASIDLLECLRVALARVQWASHAIDVIQERVDAPVMILGDKEKLTDAFDVLLRNAIDAMPDGGCLWITSCTVGCEVEIRCKDSGGGIRPDSLERIFSPIFPVKTSVENGLPWTLARLIFLAHGAGVSVQSNPQGMRITISWPSRTSS
jgi:signal transduction histidine kinase